MEDWDNDDKQQEIVNRNDGGFDADTFLQELDAHLNSTDPHEDVETYLLQALADAENAGDNAGLLTVLNEVMGFYRSQGRHQDNMWMVQRSLELAAKMQLQGTDAWTTTLINAATSMRAAGQYEQAEDLYKQALNSAEQTLQANDRRLAALHNNISLLYSETGRTTQAIKELRQALEILVSASTDPDCDVDIASTHANLASALMQLQGEQEQGKKQDFLSQAEKHVLKALHIFQNGNLQNNPHYAATLSAYGQICYKLGKFNTSVQAYEAALELITKSYGVTSDSYTITKENLNKARQAKEKAGHKADSKQITNDSFLTGSTTSTGQKEPTNRNRSGLTRTAPPAISGLQLSQAYWKQYGKPLIESKYPQYVGRIAAGLVGHGSECYGFDDDLSRDHDFGPGFCLWLTKEDYQSIGKQLQTDYQKLPQEFMGYGPRKNTVRAQGTSKRVGVFEIGNFFQSITGYREAPSQDKPHEWLLLEESTLAAATNGEVFADPLGAFLKTRQDFKTMPDDVRLSLISRRLGMISQAGQYNTPRSLQRGDGASAWLALQEFTQAVCSLIFLINNPLTVGYMPYYKWSFAGLRTISARIATRLRHVYPKLENIMRLSSSACFGGAGFGEGGKGSEPSVKQLLSCIDDVCQDILIELHHEGLTNSSETFLEWQRPYVEAHIMSQNPILHSL